jgi:hypothetical protein
LKSEKTTTKARIKINNQNTYSLRNRRCLAIADKAARAALPMHLKISAMQGGDESQSSKALQQGKLINA